ncbi:MAG TPA: hypothetical protein VHU91_08910 [Mycobacteriales bacterium]|jgi:hypothetical protein|nr:hypothetical protein [Mycobacteriales bacterium]
MSEDLAGAAVRSGREEDWLSYLEAVAGLGDLPELCARRHSDIAAEQDSTLAIARRRRDAALQETERWQTLAKRSLSNAQARLIAAKVLLPDVGAAEPTNASAEELVEQLHDAIADVDRDVVTVRAARRRAEDERLRDKAAIAAAALRRRRLIWICVGAGVVVLLLLLLAL